MGIADQPERAAALRPPALCTQILCQARAPSGAATMPIPEVAGAARRAVRSGHDMSAAAPLALYRLI